MDEKIIQLAAEIMKTTAETAATYNKPVPEIDGWYFWNPVRGGVSVLIDKNGEKLAASSAVTFQKHLEAFQAGRRN